MIQNHFILLIGLIVAFVTCIGASVWLLLREAKSHDIGQRVSALTGTRGLEIKEDRRSFSGILTEVLSVIGNRIRHLEVYSKDDIEALEAVISASGRDPKRYLPALLGVKIASMFLVPIVAFIASGFFGFQIAARTAVTVMSIAVGLLGPDYVISFLRRPYISALRKGIPDVLDLLVVCTEAGMGLESGLARVAQEMRFSNPAMSSAIVKLLDELKIMPDRRDALTAFGKRSGVDGIRRMAAILGQTLQYGTPLGQALRSIAAELRRERMLRLEERAMKLPALLVFPLIFFIMPSLFIIMGGIPFLSLSDALNSASHVSHFK